MRPSFSFPAPRTRAFGVALVFAMLFSWFGVGAALGAADSTLSRPQGPCDIYAAAGDPCVAAHSTTRALLAGYNGPLYRVMRRSDGKSIDIGVVKPTRSPVPDGGGYADAAAQDAFCRDTTCWITVLYDQSGHRNHLVQPPRGGFSGPALGGYDNLPLADMAPVTLMGHKVYGIFIVPGMGLRLNDAHGTAVDDQAEGMYWVINGLHYNSGCCFDYGNAEIDSRDDNNGTMETAYFGNSTGWYYGNRPGPWVMTDQENNLVGCVNADRSKFCPTLPSVSWRFVTAMAKGEPHHWASLAGDARRGPLSVLFDGPRIDSTYDPMRKQGAILLGNGGDNSMSSQGTFYEAAMTKAGTYPAHATDQLVQANIVAARYDVPRLVIASATTPAAPSRLHTFAPGSSKEITLAFTNTASAPVRDVRLSIAAPQAGWSTTLPTGGEAAIFAEQTAPGQTRTATFRVTSGSTAYNGDLVAHAAWTDTLTGRTVSETTADKVRNVPPVKINEFRVADGSATNQSNSFIELYNAGDGEVDLSSWSLTEHPTQQPIFSGITVPAGTRLAAHAFYLLGLANSGLAVPARAGDSSLSLLSTAGMQPGDVLEIDSGAARETRTVTAVGTPVAMPTTVWQPALETPVLTIPAGSTTIPVTSTAGFVVGQKVALGYGTTYPVVGRDLERYEVVTVKAIGRPGTQAFLAADAAKGQANIKVTSVENLSPGDRIRLDIDSAGHGIETVTVKSIGTAATRASLAADAAAGATDIRVRRSTGLAVGDQLTLGTPANREVVTIRALGNRAAMDASLTVSPALARPHTANEDVVKPGSGLEPAAPLRFNHAANLPFGTRGTGITVAPATAFAHSSNEPVQPLGTGVAIDRPLAKQHAIHVAVRDARATSAGYRGAAAPNQWFGGPALSSVAGSMVLRDARGLVVDSLNYGDVVDPWVAEGYQMVSGATERGCRVTVPAPASGPNAIAVGVANRSSGRFPDGADSDSNCLDFRTQPATTLPAGAAAGSRNLKVAGNADFHPGQMIAIGEGPDGEMAQVSEVGDAGVAAATSPTAAGTMVIPVDRVVGFVAGQTVTIGSGGTAEKAVVLAATGGRFGARISFATPLARAHPAGSQVAGSGITLTAELTHGHPAGTQVTSDVPTPGAPNRYVMLGSAH
jgi:hypothetical protein